MMQGLLRWINRIFIPPAAFDQNEYFILVNLLGFLWVIFLAKRFPLVVKILILLFGMCTAVMLDHSLATPPLDLYDIGDYDKYELFDELGYLMYTPYAYLSVYLFDKFNPKGLMFPVYLIVLSLLGIVFEWGAVHFHVFTYKNWNLVYSFPIYLVVSLLQLMFFRFLMNHFGKVKGSWRKNGNRIR